jgi:hypothetical protein
MKFGIGAVTALLLLVGPSADAFQVSKPMTTSTVVQRQIQAANELVTRPHMAAGGAERAYGDDYYEGAFVVVLRCGSRLDHGCRSELAAGLPIV